MQEEVPLLVPEDCHRLRKKEEALGRGSEMRARRARAGGPAERRIHSGYLVKLGRFGTGDSEVRRGVDALAWQSR